MWSTTALLLPQGSQEEEEEEEKEKEEEKEEEEEKEKEKEDVGPSPPFIQPPPIRPLSVWLMGAPAISLYCAPFCSVR